MAKLPSPWRPARRNFRCLKNAGHIDESEKLPEGSSFLFCTQLYKNRKVEGKWESNEMGSPLMGSGVVHIGNNRVAADFSSGCLGSMFLHHI